MMPPITRRHKRNNPEYCEPAMTKYRLNVRTAALLMVMALLFSGCASVNLDSHVAETASEAIDIAADETDRQEAHTYLLRAADRFQNRNQHRDARKILQSEQFAAADEAIANQRVLLSMASATALDDTQWAVDITSEIKPDHFLNYDQNLIDRAARLQEKNYRLAGNNLAAAITLILLAESDAQADTQSLHDDIWQNLKQTPDSQLADERDLAIGYEAQGWLELAGILREPEANLDEQGRMIRNWQNNWPDHPAATTLPAELQLIASLAETRPERITLAIPLSGPLASAGAAIRDGFFAAFYEDESADREKISLRVVDTSDRPFPQIYEELTNEDQDLIVGPLEKDALATLSDMDSLPVPVLGLNYLPSGMEPPSGLYQFGLSAEDEARQIANRMTAEGIEQVLVLIPAGEWGDRLETALLQRLEQNDGVALDIERYFREDNLRAVTADLLGITVSRDRAIDVERTAGINVEFEPRRRQDADGIVMVAEPTIARQFKPLFAFYFGGNLPVYSPSMVYEGSPDPSRDRDLNGVIFTDTPWILKDDNQFRSIVKEAMPDIRGQLGRLFAMGADAWNLSKRLPLLKHVDGATIEGQTGKLTMTPEGSIHRKQLWAQFRNGTPERLPPLEKPSTMETQKTTELPQAEQ
ncbi:penicillin-binding protein activator [Marinobacter sp. TBZ242]|uniref:Penicillin-binding protein activator n=1 Tax=Marinobacter azerbaijanicus TaxID=3050455 RepID=A0ABT7IC86_9GAMM|nr:penicillin-binding protein activator [Marinobacter sp. TBZ242]MDL0430739.1 penicillin-binding protein activator [Marinobacter sp. TBZ242]